MLDLSEMPESSILVEMALSLQRTDPEMAQYLMKSGVRLAQKEAQREHEITQREHEIAQREHEEAQREHEEAQREIKRIRDEIARLKKGGRSDEKGC